MTKEELKKRTKTFHLAVIKTCELLPKNAVGFELAKQLIRSAGSVGANYKAACRAKSTADFSYKIEIIIEKLMKVCIGWKSAAKRNYYLVT